MDPKTKTTTHIKIKSHPERRTINKAELVAITTALDLYKHAPTLSILTDSAFGINNLGNYSSNPQNFTHHQHKDLLHIADNIIYTRDDLGYTTHIIKVKLHTGVTHIDEADEGARNVVEGAETPNIIFTSADPPIERLRTWPQARPHNQDTTFTIKNLADLHSGLRKIIKTRPFLNKTQTYMAYSHIL